MSLNVFDKEDMATNIFSFLSYDDQARCRRLNKTCSLTSHERLTQAMSRAMGIVRQIADPSLYFERAICRIEPGGSHGWGNGITVIGRSGIYAQSIPLVDGGFVRLVKGSIEATSLPVTVNVFEDRLCDLFTITVETKGRPDFSKALKRLKKTSDSSTVFQKRMLLIAVVVCMVVLFLKISN